MKIVSVTWNSYIPTLLKAAEELGIELKAYYSKILEENPEETEDVLAACENADAIFIYHIANPFWEDFYKKLEPLKSSIPIICVGSNPSSFTSSVNPKLQPHVFHILSTEEGKLQQYKIPFTRVFGAEM